MLRAFNPEDEVLNRDKISKAAVGCSSACVPNRHWTQHPAFSDAAPAINIQICALALATNWDLSIARTQ